MCAEAQWTDFPTYEKKKPWTTAVNIVTIGTLQDEMVVSLAVSGSYNFNSETYLEYTNPSNGAIKKVFMTDFRRETGENAMKLASYGYHVLSLTFPPIPNGVNKLNLISPKIKLWGISIRTVNVEPPKRAKRIARTEPEIQKLVKNSALDIAGVYEPMGSSNSYAVVKFQDTIYVIFVKSNNNDKKVWKCGEVRGILRTTSVSNVYKATWLLDDKSEVSAVITFDSKSMTVNIKDLYTDEEYTSLLFKMDAKDNSNSDEITQGESWTGTGYAIGNKYVVTNNHVVDRAKNIIIKGIKGDMNNGYSAEVVATDKTNDIAVLKITDSLFRGFGTIPYSVSSRMADVGEDVYVLGYPLTQALGDEIKLTNGIVNSRTGYQGDVSTYQISAPVQPGNSGGPMFDNKGNVIGIVVAGVPGAENVGYAVKNSYLKILIESAGLDIKFPTNNTISTYSLTEKVKCVKNFVFYIECSK